MSTDEVEVVRAFNRTVTERVGALDDRFLGRSRPLGEARLLWEIGEAGCELRSLRSRLALDSGYLSRLLRALEAAGLVTVTASEHDRRVRMARLTSKGGRERAVLNERSDALARSLLGALAGSERERLVSAMRDVERLLTAATVEIIAVDPDHHDARHCLRQYYAELDRRFHAGFDPGASLPADADDVRPPAGVFLVAYVRGEPVGCGALKRRGRAPIELKRLWVASAARGLGLGRRLLAALEQEALDRGCRVIRLDTNRTLTEAITMYRAAGYREIPAFNDEPYAHHWFEKRLR